MIIVGMGKEFLAGVSITDVVQYCGDTILRNTYRSANAGLDLGLFIKKNTLGDANLDTGFKKFGHGACVLATGTAAATCGLAGGVFGIGHTVWNFFGNLPSVDAIKSGNPLGDIKNAARKKVTDGYYEAIKEKWTNLRKNTNNTTETDALNKLEYLEVPVLKEILKDVTGEYDIRRVMNQSFALDGKTKTAQNHILDAIKDGTGDETLLEFATKCIKAAKKEADFQKEKEDLKNQLDHFILEFIKDQDTKYGDITNIEFTADDKKQNLMAHINDFWERNDRLCDLENKEHKNKVTGLINLAINAHNTAPVS